MDCVGILAIVSGYGCDYLGGGGGVSDQNPPTRLLQGPDVTAVHTMRNVLQFARVQAAQFLLSWYQSVWGQVSSVVHDTYFQLIEGGE